MRPRGKFSLLRLGTILAVASALAACTKGGQFDPTTVLDSDMFDSKKPLPGTREPVFPNGVPGASTGIPSDLYKGYQPPPDQAAANPDAVPITPTVGAEPRPAAVAQVSKPKKPKPKPKPKVASEPEGPRTRISVGLHKQQPATASQQQSQSSQTAWPGPPSNTAQSSQTAWPAPPSNQAQSSQTVWPAPPPSGGGQQAAQPSQSIWPNPPPTGGQ
jgi:hypothetical protein